MSSAPQARVSKPRVVVITGATGDTGHATAAVLLAAGHTVVAIGSDEGRLAGVPASARYVCDLTDRPATAALGARVHAEVGPVDALVHLVGGWRAGNNADDWDWLEPRVLTSLRLSTLSFIDDLTASASGRLISIGSTAAQKPTWSGANYATLKTAASAWVAAVASGWRKAGTGAAIELLVRSIGDDGTSVQTIASRILELIDGSAAELNGSQLDLTA